jgi:hypothetical protein
MELKIVINECLYHLIFKLEENILFDYYNYTYGKITYRIYSSSIRLDYCRRVFQDGSWDNEKLIEMDFDKKEYPKRMWFWYDKEKKEEITRMNKIYSLLVNRNLAIERQEILKRNETIISCLPEERQKQIYREAKLKRITSDNQ